MAALLAAACREREERQAERVAAEALAAERTTAQRVTAERLAAVRGEVSGDEPRDSANRPPAPLGATASRWRPFRIHRAVATPQGLVFSHDGPTDETALSIAATGRPDRRLLDGLDHGLRRKGQIDGMRLDGNDRQGLGNSTGRQRQAQYESGENIHVHKYKHTLIY